MSDYIDSAVLEEHPDPETAAVRLRAFEDETLGVDAPRISGQIEKGHGSFFKTKLIEAQRIHHAKLEHLVTAEKALADSHAALMAAEAAHEKAKADAEASAGQIAPVEDEHGDEPE